uniref:Uncharacterized protein n=1 Tax=Lactuca sativa TaxID=4236 RepID=A0A9R1XPB4_LACSA|nr:hypothetical protein LSAT_V11C400174440 [Lactuca sativa]
MVKDWSMTRNQNRDTSRKIPDNGGVVPWSYLNHDVLLLVIMQLELILFHSVEFARGMNFISLRPNVCFSVDAAPEIGVRAILIF